MLRKALVLDANILIRAVLGQRVRRILEFHAENISFFLPESAYAEAEEHLAALVVKRRGDPSKALIALKAMAALVTIVGDDLYRDFEGEARKRLGARDPEDWPILAAALALGCPIWTEDTDFFGCGVATWTSGSIDIFLAQ
jgi:predicted nucleic acid-binding protein